MARNRRHGFRLNVRLLHKIGLVVAFNYNVGLLQALLRIALLRVNHAAYVVRIIGVDDLLVADRIARVGDRRKHLILGGYELCRLIGLLLRLRGDDCDDIAEEAHAVDRNGILIDEDFAEHLFAGNVLSRYHTHNAGRALRFFRMYGKQFCMWILRINSFTINGFR